MTQTPRVPQIVPPRLPQVPDLPAEPMKVVLASHNAKKLAELQRLVESEQLFIEIVGLDAWPEHEAPAETGTTFAQNALIKARAAAQATGLPALADDSGIEVDALNDMPGIRSARWDGPACDDRANLELLLRPTDDVPTSRRGARFVCVMAFATPEGFEETRPGIWPGSLATEARGSNGFGYDPIFIPEGSELTSAELSPEQKDAESHRSRAVREILEVLKDYQRDQILGGGTDAEPRSNDL